MPPDSSLGSPSADTNLRPVGRDAHLIISLFLFVLALLCLAPMAEAVVQFDTVTPLDEHRNRVRPPDFNLIVSKGGGAFAEALNAWVDDHVGLRDLYIRSKNQIDYSVFGVSRKVYIGSNGWLFERATTNNRFSIERIDEGRYQSLERAFDKLANDLAKRGVRLVVISYPDKSKFYHEFLPNDVPDFSHLKRIDRLKAFLRARSDIIFIDAEAILEPHKGEGNLFYKTDIHVNGVGNLLVVEEIVRRLARAEGREDIKWHEKFDFVASPWAHGSEARFLGVLQPVSEPVLSAPNLYGLDKAAPGDVWNMDKRRVRDPDGSSYPIFDFEYVSAQQSCVNKFPGAMLFGNSFSDTYWALGLQNYFCFIRRTRTPSSRLKPYLDDMPKDTKYFIFQFLDAYLPGEGPLE